MDSTCRIGYRGLLHTPLPSRSQPLAGFPSIWLAALTIPSLAYLLSARPAFHRFAFRCERSGLLCRCGSLEHEGEPLLSLFWLWRLLEAVARSLPTFRIFESFAGSPRLQLASKPSVPNSPAECVRQDNPAVLPRLLSVQMRYFFMVPETEPADYRLGPINDMVLVVAPFGTAGKCTPRRLWQHGRIRDSFQTANRTARTFLNVETREVCAASNRARGTQHHPSSTTSAQLYLVSAAVFAITRRKTVFAFDSFPSFVLLVISSVIALLDSLEYASNEEPSGSSPCR